MNHTPGPWEVRVDTGEYGTYHLLKDIGGETIGERNNIDYANARLIASAPEMKKGLKRLFDAWHECPEDSVPDALQDVFIEYEADAIAKAKE